MEENHKYPGPGPDQDENRGEGQMPDPGRNGYMQKVRPGGQPEEAGVPVSEDGGEPDINGGYGGGQGAPVQNGTGQSNVYETGAYQGSAYRSDNYQGGTAYQNNTYQYGSYAYPDAGRQDYAGGYQQYGGMPPYPDNRPELEEPVKISEWVLAMVLMMIPCVNIIMMFVWAFSNTEKKSKSNFFKAYLIFFGISMGIMLLVWIAVVIFALMV